MSEYNKVCGAAFEDLTQEEMMDYDGGITPTVVLSYIGYSLLSAAVSAASAVSVTYIFR
jgi:hypothetical protein